MLISKAFAGKSAEHTETGELRSADVNTERQPRLGIHRRIHRNGAGLMMWRRFALQNISFGGESFGNTVPETFREAGTTFFPKYAPNSAGTFPEDWKPVRRNI
jgi:hypothetical protein